MTPGAVVWSAFRRWFAPREQRSRWVKNRKGKRQCRYRRVIVPIPHRSGTVHDLEKASWYGGTVEIYRAGKVAGPVYVLDVASAYPTVMLENQYPIEYSHTEWGLEPEELLDLTRTWGAVSIVQITSDSDTYPVRHGEHVVMARGLFWTVLAGPELIRALKRGHVACTGETAFYRLGMPFEKFMLHLLGIKDKVRGRFREVWSDVWKRMSVAFYGKFGSKQRYWTPVPGKIPPEPWHTWYEDRCDTGELTWYRAIGMQVQREVKGDWQPYACPVVCAYVCSYLREQMRVYQDIAGDRHVYLRAVDCLHVDRAGFDALRAGKCVWSGEPGRLRTKEVADSAEYLSGSYYKIGKRNVIMGVPSEAMGDERRGYWVDYMPSPDSLLTEPPDTPVRSVRRKVQPHREYRGGKPTGDGWYEPLELRDDWDAIRAMELLLDGGTP